MLCSSRASTSSKSKSFPAQGAAANKSSSASYTPPPIFGRVSARTSPKPETRTTKPTWASCGQVQVLPSPPRARMTLLTAGGATVQRTTADSEATFPVDHLSNQQQLMRQDCNRKPIDRRTLRSAEAAAAHGSSCRLTRRTHPPWDSPSHRSEAHLGGSGRRQQHPPGRSLVRLGLRVDL